MGILPAKKKKKTHQIPYLMGDVEMGNANFKISEIMFDVTDFYN